MISRTYVVQMPNDEGATTLVNILVQDDPGTPSVPASQGSANWFEWRGRPIRFETVAADGVAGGFVPRLRLGFSYSIAPMVSLRTPIATVVPSVAFSESLIPALPSLEVPVLADPSGMPAIQLTGSSDTASHLYVLSLQIMEAKDEGRTGEGI